MGEEAGHSTVPGRRLASVSYLVQEEFRPVSKSAQPQSTTRTDDNVGQAEQPDLMAGDDTVLEKAREELLRAEETYRRTLERTAAGASQARDITVGDMIDGSLEFVRRHPVAGLLAAGVVSFLVGRATRR